MYGYGNGAAASLLASPAWGQPGYGGGEHAKDHHHAVRAPLQKGFLQRSNRRKMNLTPIIMSLVVPVIVFCVVFGSLSFEVHYEDPFLCYLVVFGALVVVALCGCFAGSMAWQKHNNVERQPNWLFFLFLSMLLAWVVGFIGGSENWAYNTFPYFRMRNLNRYTGVSPSRIRGQQIMDAGRITFAEGSKLDVSKSMGFRNFQVYCVAPITLGNTSLDTYDFWAVGKDCCNGYSADFHCEGFNDPRALGGLRLMNDEDRAFYRLAVQQAESMYNIKATHPLFFHWVQDADAVVQDWKETGSKQFLIGSLSFFVLQAFLVATAAVAFSKLGDY
mmetsp:Transcript_26220/g.57671  ORF Transcript_26220/g.57671 Transcript_26220/m.57671 type:complete len:331 (+) Transcript_26220:53-1045(+)